jgi:hypothetical protein
MAWALSDPRDAAALAAPSPRRLSFWQRWIRAMSDPYRPELHYMRGPGPKWHAKHGRTFGQPGVGCKAGSNGGRPLWTHII